MTPSQSRRRDFISLALTQRRLAGNARINARSARDAGKTDEFHRYAAEARRLFREAKDNISTARMLTAPAIERRIAA